MLKESPATSRQFRTVHLDCDLVVIGGGMAGTCCAITATRAGLRVTLIQDRPVLGGNASSEVRLWVLGATAHMSNNNRWAREGGVIDELLVENTFRNREGNPLLFDTILLEKVISEPNLTLLLNTAVIEASKADPDTIQAVRAFCSQNSTLYEVHAPLFCDASGDGVLGFLAGAAFRMGAEAHDEFGEKFAPSAEYGELLGHSIYFYSKDTGQPVKFVPPIYALDDIHKIPRYRSFNAKEFGCRLWWIEYGGRLDTVHETETIKWELWKVVYGVWNHIKNSGEFPEAETLTLEWVGQIPGKRESRRFEGDYMLRQQDLVEQRRFYDAVAFGGWSIDLHPADGIFSEKPGCNQWHARGIFGIPYRCLYSRNIRNLFLAGRIISASHVAFGSTRVMATCAHAAQAVGMAAAICKREKLLPAQLADADRVRLLQRHLMRNGQHIPGFHLDDSQDLARQAKITASSQLRLMTLAPDGPLLSLKSSWAQMLPLAVGAVPQATFIVDVSAPTTLQLELRTSDRPDNYTPDVLLAKQSVELQASQNQTVRAAFAVRLDQPRYGFFCLMKNEQVSVRCSEQRLTGVLSVAQRHTQKPAADIGVETFEFWCPQRRPNGHNFAFTLEPPLEVFAPANVTNGLQRPTSGPNAWVADWSDAQPSFTLQWDTPQSIARLELCFDTDYDHPMESVLMGHPEAVMPFCVQRYQVLDDAGRIVAQRENNHQPRNTIIFDTPVTTSQIVLQLRQSYTHVPAALMEVRCYRE
ncbi:MAG: FAD-dependent oxidoreductase [Abitibacteriaceae bacterium]|nr:FAD-dependent oxidoreductase [Abditibacteriaceae bacterium]